MQARTVLALVALLQLAAVWPAGAQTPCTSPSADCVVVGDLNLSLSIGLGQRSNPLKGASDIPLVLVPHLSYYRERFFIENLEIGYTLYESGGHTLNALATPGYDRVFFVRDDPQNYVVTLSLGDFGGGIDSPRESVIPLRRRRTTYLTGLEWLTRSGPFIGQLGAFYEATGRHKGFEIRGAAAAPLMQRADSLVLSGGFTWKSAEVVDYYYGVDGRYEPGAAFSPFVRLGYARPLSERWAFGAFVHYERLAAAIADSPIVGEHGVTTVFAGFTCRIL